MKHDLIQVTLIVANEVRTLFGIRQSLRQFVLFTSGLEKSAIHLPSIPLESQAIA